MQEPAKQPIRVYASLASAQTEAERADLLLAEIDRTGALDRSVFALFSPPVRATSTTWRPRRWST